jgi:formamidopyrimidine-DNA glycosylase
VPEIPDLAIYLEHLDRRIRGQKIDHVRIANPFVLRTVDPPISAIQGRTVTGFRRIGKRLVFVLDGDLFLVIHLMIAGRLQWRAAAAPLNRKLGLAAFDFASGTLVLTEASQKKRASLHVIRGEDALAKLDPGGMEVLGSTRAGFTAALTKENHTLKRALTDPTLLAGIGNAYSDEILHRARLSPLKLTSKLEASEIARLHAAVQKVLTEWTDRLREETGDAFPSKVTAFRPGMAVHGRFGQPCPVCGSPVERIAYAENEANYCPKCQTGGKLLADRSLSRLLKEDWPKTVEEREESMARKRADGGGSA